MQAILYFFRHEAASGIILLFFALLAMGLANSPWAESYQAFLAMPLPLGPAAWHLDFTLLHWVNDALMAVFFFVIGLELKREIRFGELRSLSATILPISAAVGGMLVPALLYYFVNQGTAGAAGWGIPMATDIAFALGILSIAARNAPMGIVIFLTALAIVDDLGAIIVIALFYSADISLPMLGVGVFVLGVAYLFGRRAVQHAAPYLLCGVLAWFCFLNAGIHPTIAGVALGLLIPVGAREGEGILYRLEHRLEPWSAYVIMPIFAFANAGVAVTDGIAALTHPVAVGILLGLCIGKPLGICGALWLICKRLSISLPTGVRKGHLLGAGALSGIGFTMSLFIASLAFSDEALIAIAKMGILSASLCSALIGTVIFFLQKGKAS